jgi:hypothetical protein
LSYIQLPAQTEKDAERAIIPHLLTTQLDTVPQWAVIPHLLTTQHDTVPQWAIISHLLTTQLKIVPQRVLVTDLSSNDDRRSLFDREVSRRYFDRAVLGIDLIHFDQ